MDLRNIKVGMVVKNYRVMCKILNEPIRDGNSKTSQIKEWERFFCFHKEGIKFIIDDIYESPKNKPKLNQNRFGRGNHNWTEYENFKIPYSMRNNYGVYKITNGDNIYIGSTKVGFRKRFMQHRKCKDTNMKHVKDLLLSGGDFEILFDMTDVIDIDLIRMVEDYFIKYFMYNKKYNCVNVINGSYKEHSDKYISIKVKENNYISAIQLLVQNGLIEPQYEDDI
ncbi:MAG: GIY-YIG nuclease family protein [Peptostreptococcaceae bacterium]